jgi:hypothetical protein
MPNSAKCETCSKRKVWALVCPSCASPCSSGSAESQDGGKAMWSEAEIAAFKPVCDDIKDEIERRLRYELNYTRPKRQEVLRVVADVMQEILRELTEKANSTPA